MALANIPSRTEDVLIEEEKPLSFIEKFGKKHPLLLKGLKVLSLAAMGVGVELAINKAEHHYMMKEAIEKDNKVFIYHVSAAILAGKIPLSTTKYFLENMAEEILTKGKKVETARSIDDFKNGKFVFLKDTSKFYERILFDKKGGMHLLLNFISLSWQVYLYILTKYPGEKEALNTIFESSKNDEIKRLTQLYDAYEARNSENEWETIVAIVSETIQEVAKVKRGTKLLIIRIPRLLNYPSEKAFLKNSVLPLVFQSSTLNDIKAIFTILFDRYESGDCKLEEAVCQSITEKIKKLKSELFENSGESETYEEDQKDRKTSVSPELVSYVESLKKQWTDIQEIQDIDIAALDKNTCLNLIKKFHPDKTKREGDTDITVSLTKLLELVKEVEKEKKRPGIV